jgi:hypothetical protein
MSNDIITNIGEDLTFFQLFSEKKWKIEIPIIQRDYAQGRKSTQEIRDEFLNTLFDHLSTGENIVLDFVYGSLSEWDNTIFIPLDGQQRLTTLFLLHWYLANKDKETKIFKDNLSEAGNSKFTYETRTSSSDFCDELVRSSFDMNNLLPADTNKFNSLSKTICDCAWYYRLWDNDPTIKSMLTMLDSIHERFKSSVGFFEKLRITVNPVISFQFLNLKEFKLTDDLYIKMNARGKQLTPFENFKAKLEQYIKKLIFDDSISFKLVHQDKERVVSVYEYFLHKIDNEWANLFWNYKSEKTHVYDSQLLNFIRVLATNHYLLKESNTDKKDENIKKLIDKSVPLSFMQYKEMDCFDEKFILDLIKTFDLLTNGDLTIKQYLSSSFHYDENDIFQKAIKNDLTYTERLRFFAFYKYLINSNGLTSGLEDWMRVIYNLSENTIYNRAEEYIRSANSIQALLPNSRNILTYLADKNNPISGFFDMQITEERIKAILLQKIEAWKTVIFDIEKHGYFNGQISFILDFSGIENYYHEHFNCSWSEDEDDIFLNEFNNYSKKAKLIFDDNGKVSFNNFEWQRALLTKGFYLLYKNSNWSFLIDIERDISWKKLLRDDNGGKRLLVKQIFDDIEFNTEDIQKSLENITSGALKYVDGWRKHILETPKILSYLGYYKFIRFNNDHDIYLLKGQRLSGVHAEFYSYSFFIKYLLNRKSNFSPFTNTWYYDVSGDTDLPCAVIDEWTYKNTNYALDVRYLSHEKKYEIRFFYREIGEFCPEILDIINSVDFGLSNRYGGDSYTLLFEEADELNSRIVDLCNSFNNLVQLPL